MRVPSLYVRLSRLALVVYLAAVAIVVFQPQPELAVGSVTTMKDIFLAVGVPERWATDVRVEFFMNTVLFVPITFLGAFAFRRVRWSEWVVVAFVGSGFIEVTQGLFIAGRSAQFADLVSNTSGGLIGALCVLAVRAVVAYAARSREMSST